MRNSYSLSLNEDQWLILISAGIGFLIGFTLRHLLTMEVAFA